MRSRSLAIAALAFLAAWALPGSALGEVLGPFDIQTAFQGESAPLTQLADEFAQAAPTTPAAPGAGQEVRNMRIRPPMLADRMVSRSTPDPVRQVRHLSAPTPPPLLSFDGTEDTDNAALLGILLVPPDTEGDVGKDYYVQMNNVIFEIFDKQTGATVLGPLPNNIFFAGTGTFCDIFNDGDPVVLYDHEAKRWIFSQFAVFEFVPAIGGFVSHQCFAVSQTKDPLGAYYLYDFVWSVPSFGGFAALNDYPKIGVWPNGLYVTVNEFEFGTPFTFVGASVGVVDKAAMYNGLPASAFKFVIPFTNTAPAHFSLQPSHWEGNKKPKVNGKTAPNMIVQAFDDETWGNGGVDGPDGYYLWAFTPDFATPANSTFASLGLIQSATFDSNLCNFSECVPQLGVPDLLDSLSQFTMFRAQYRSFDGYNSIVVSHTVDADGFDTAGMRWAELRNSGAGWSVFQAGTYAPADGENRWMGSIAQDRKGNIALGYSVSSTATYPSVYYTGRSSHDPPGTMGSEQLCHAGSGSQVGSANRWGDYSTMSVDPVDDCTFWYTQEYYQNTGSFDFKTRICSFKFDNCGGPKN